MKASSWWWLVGMVLTGAAVIIAPSANAVADSGCYTMLLLDGTAGAGLADMADINNSGQVVALMRASGTAKKSVLWDRNGVQDLAASIGAGTPWAIGNSGAIVGSVDGGAGFELRQSRLTRLAGRAAFPRAVNSHDVVVGSYVTDSGLQHPALWQDGELHELESGARVAKAVAEDINDSGAIAGHMGLSPYAWNAADGKARRLELPDQYADAGSAYGINNAGQIVGSVLSYGQKSVLWEPDGSVRYLDPHPTESQALDINDRGQVVGWQLPDSSALRSVAMLWDRDGGRDLNTVVCSSSPGMLLTLAFAINDSGQIVARAMNKDGDASVARVVVLTPPGAVAEPTQTPTVAPAPPTAVPSQPALTPTSLPQAPTPSAQPPTAESASDSPADMQPAQPESPEPTQADTPEPTQPTSDEGSEP